MKTFEVEIDKEVPLQGYTKVVAKRYKVPAEITCPACQGTLVYDMTLKAYEHKFGENCFRFVDLPDYISRHVEND